MVEARYCRRLRGRSGLSRTLSTGAAVLNVATGEALAALSLPPGVSTPVTITVETHAAELLHFETLLRP
jgi:hypothetical protein